MSSSAPSRLATAQSAYLRSAAHQPVDWHSWGPEAFERARRENKPILLDIGAVWCHWCHVMDGESYENPEVARILNSDWICIKVDRDERPDVDARYQRAVQALTQQGGWPLTAFLTPTGDVFYGGTYFPPDERYGRPGFGSVLSELARLFREQPQRIATQAQEVRQHVIQVLAESHAGPVDPSLLPRAADSMAQLFDFRHGGFGGAPKFPHPAACEFLLARWFDTGDKWPREIVDRTLAGMARGGIYDQIGGGFHRYAVDATWTVPHFEKMSYDNSELLRVYVHATAAAAGEAGNSAREQSPAPHAPHAPHAPGAAAVDYKRVISGITDWVRDVMSDPAGGYYSSQDADVGLDDDGDYFTWTADEAGAVTSAEEFEILKRHYDIGDTGEMHHDPKKNVLWVAQTVSEIAGALGKPDAEISRLLAAGREKLRKARGSRQAPFVDTTLYTGWNAMMASAMLEAARMVERAGLEEHALLTLERLFREASEGDGYNGVRHAIGSEIGGILEDQVHVANASIDAYETTGDPHWLERAVRLGEYAWKHFADDDGGLTDTARGRGGEGFLQQGIKPVQDSPTPSPNGVAGIVAARLAEHTGNSQWRTRLERLLAAFAGGVAQLSIHAATFIRALDCYINPPTHIVVVGDPGDPATRALHRAALAAYRPRKVVTVLRPGAGTSALPAPLRAMVSGQAPRAYVCSGPQCAAPAENPEQLIQTLAILGRA